MPSQRSLSDWVAKNHLGFTEKYLEAKRVAAHFLAEKALDEAYNAAEDFYLDDDGRPVFDGHHVQRSKLIIDTIKWEVSKMLPRIYGDKVTQEFGVTGDLAALIEAASNRDSGLPPPIDGEYKVCAETEPPRSLLEAENSMDDLRPNESTRPQSGHSANTRHVGVSRGPSTPSNHSKKRARRRIDR